MPGNSQGIVVSIQAKIEGWQNQIKAIQDALKNMKAGTGISKDLTKDLKQVETLVNNLGKNINQRLTSDSQITGFTDKLREVDEIFAHMGQRMTSVSFADMDPSYITNNFKDLSDAIEQANNALSNGMTNSFQNAIAESTNLQKAFDKLGIDPSKMGAEELKKLLETKSSNLTEEIAKTNKEIDNLRANAKAAKQTMEEMQKTKILQVTDTKAESKAIVGDTSNLGTRQMNTAALQELETKINDVILKGGATLEQKLKDKRDQIDKAIKDLVNAQSVEEARKKLQEIQDLFASVKAKGDFTRDIKIDKITDDQLTQWIPDPAAVQNKLTEIKSVLAEYKIDPTVLNKINMEELIKQGNFDKLEDEIDKALRKTQDVAEKDIQKIKQTFDKLKGLADTKQRQVMSDSATKYNIDQGLSQWDSILQKVQAENATLREEVEKLKAQLAQRAIANVKALGKKTAASGAQGIQDSTNAAKAYEAQLGRVKSAEQALGKLQGVVQRWFSIYAVIRMVSNAVRSMISTIQELDKTITNIAIVTDMGQDDLWAQMPKYTQMARDYASSIAGVYEVSQLYYQQGLEMADVMSLTEATLKMARISGLGYADATDYMTNAVRSFKMEMSEANTVVDVYSAVAASSATSVTELATAMSKTASSAEAVGSSFQNTTAMMAVMIEATRESPENIGSALKSIISRYGELKENKTGIDSEGEEYSLNKVDTALQSIGISIHDVNGEFRNFDDVIMELAGKWDTVDKNTQRYIATVMAGNRQQSRFLALVSSGDRLRELADEAANSEDASQLQFLKSLDSIDSKVQQLQTSIQALYTNSGLEQIYKGILDFANRVVTSLDNISNNQGLAGVVGKIASIFTTAATLVTNLFTTIKLKFSNMQAQMTAEAVLGSAKRAAQDKLRAVQEETDIEKKKALWQEYQAYKTKVQQEEDNKRLTSELKASTKSRTTGMFATAGGLIATTIASSLDVNENRQLKAGLTGLGGVLSGVGTGMMIGGMPGALMGIVTALPSVMESIGMWSESVEDTIKKLETNITEANNQRIKSKNELETLDDYKKKYDELNKSQYESNETKQAFIDLQNEIAEKYPELISRMDEEGNYTVNLTEGYKQLAAAKREAYKSDLINTMGAEIASLNNIDYVLKNVYGHTSLTNQKTLLGINTDNYEGLLDIDYSKTTDAIDALTSKIWNTEGINNQNYNIAKRLFNKNQNFDTVSGPLTFTYTDMGDELSKESSSILNDIYLSFVDSMKEGLDLNSAKAQVKQNFDSQYAQLIDNFDSSFYKELQLRYNIPSYQKDLVNNRLNAYTTEYINLIADSADAVFGTESGSLEKRFAKEQLSKEWNVEYDKLIERQSSGEDIDWSEEINNFYQSHEEFWYNIQLESEVLSGMDSAAREFYDSMGQHTLSEINELFKLKDITNLEGAELEAAEQFNKLQEARRAFFNGIFTKDYQAIITNYNKWLESDSVTEFKIKDFSQLIGPDFLNGIQEKYNTILNSTVSSGTKQSQINLLNQIYDTATSENISAKERNSILTALHGADLFSITGIYDAIEAIEKLQLGNNGKTITDALDKLSELISVNLTTEIGNLLNSYGSQIESFTKDLSNASKGLDFKSAAELADKLKLNLSDFNQIGDKFYLKDLTNLQDYYIQEDKKYQQALRDHIQQKKDLYETTTELPVIETASEYFDLEAYINSEDEESRRLMYEYWEDEIKSISPTWTFENLEKYRTNRSEYNRLNWINEDQFKQLSKEYSFETGTKEFNLNEILKNNNYNLEAIENELTNEWADILENANIDSSVLLSDIKSYIDNGDFSQTLAEYTANESYKLLDSVTEAEQQAVQYLIASTQLSAGDIQGFLNTTLGKVGKTEEEYLAELRESAGGIEYQGMREAAHEMAENERAAIENAIASGETSNLPEDLQKYAKLIHDTFNSVEKNVADAMFSAAKGGETQIFADQKNLKTIKDYAKQGLIKGYNAENADTMTADQYYEFDEEAIKVLYEDDEKFYAWLDEQTSFTKEQRKAYISARFNFKYPKIKAYNSTVSLLEKDTLTASDIQSYMTDINAEEQDVEKFLADHGAKLNAFGEVIIESEKQWNALLEASLGEAPGDNASAAEKEAYEKAKAKLESARRSHDASAEIKLNKAAEDVINNYNSFTEAQYDALQQAMSTEDWTALSTYITGDTVNGYSINLADLKKAIDDGTLKISDATKEKILSLIDSAFDSAISYIGTINNLMINGTTKESDMSEFTKKMNQLREEGYLSGSQDPFTNENFFEWNEMTKSFEMRELAYQRYLQGEKARLAELNYSTEQIDALIVKQAAEGVHIDDFLKATNTSEGSQARQKLFNEIKTWRLSHNNKYSDEWVNYYIKQLEAGGDVAVEVLKQIAADQGVELSAEQISNVYRAKVNKIVEAADQATEAVIGNRLETSSKLFTIMHSLGMADSNGVVTSTKNMVEVYRELYEQMKATSEKTVVDLNKLYAKQLTASESEEMDAISVLEDAMSMTYESLGELLGKYGQSLEQWLAQNKDLYELVGGGKLRITNFNALAQQMGWDFGSEEYVSAFKTYNNALIDLNKKTEKTILEEVLAVENAQAGDLLDLTQFSVTYQKALAKSTNLDDYLKQAEEVLRVHGGDRSASSIASEMAQSAKEFNSTIINTLNEQLFNVGAVLSDGILTLLDNADPFGILSVLSNAIDEIERSGEDIDFGEAGAKIKDSLNNITKSYFDSISSGMSGTLTNEQASKLVQYAKAQTGQTLDFTETAEGLQLTEDSFFSLYSILKKTNKMMAKKLLPDMTKISTKYKNLGEAMEEYAEALKLDEFFKAEALRDFLDDMLANPDTYKLMDYDLPPTWESADNFYQSAKKAYDVTQQMKKGSVGVGDFTAFAQSLINSGDNFAKQKGLELLQKGADFIGVDAKGNTVVDMNQLAKALNVKNLAKWADDYYTIWKDAAKKIQEAGVNQQKAYNTLYFGSEALDGADIYDDTGDISGSKIKALIDQQDTQGKNIETLLSKVKSGDKSLADLIKAGAELDAKQKAAIKALVGTNWENGHIKEQMMTAFDGMKGRAVFKENGEFTIDLGADEDFNIVYEFGGKQISQEDYAIMMRMKAKEGFQDISHQIKDTSKYSKQYTYKLGDMQVIAKIGIDGKVIYTIDGEEYDSTEYNAIERAMSQKSAKDVTSEWKPSEDIRKAISYKAGEVAITMTINTSGQIKYNGEVDGKKIEGDNEQDVIAAMAALGDEKAQELISGLPSEERSITVDGVKYKIIVKEGITTVEIDDDEQKKKDPKVQETRQKIADQVAKQNQGQSIDVPINTPVNATISNINMKLAEGASPQVDFGTTGIVVEEAKGVIKTLKVKAENTEAEGSITNAQLEAMLDDTTVKVVIDKDEAMDDLEKIKSEAGNISKLKPMITVKADSATNNTKALLNDIVGLINQIASTPTLEVKVKYSQSGVIPKAVDGVATTVSNTAGGDKKDQVSSSSKSSGKGKAAGNIALAKGNKILMGELGPELVVSNGHYFIVGQGGAEMVTLADDAIVFNHIQTRQLLKHGRTSQNGRAITNEYKAAGEAHASNKNLYNAVKKQISPKLSASNDAAYVAALNAVANQFQQVSDRLVDAQTRAADVKRQLKNKNLSKEEQAKLQHQDEVFKNEAKTLTKVLKDNELPVPEITKAVDNLSSTADSLGGAASAQQSAASAQQSAAAATSHAAIDISNMRNAWASQQDPRGGLTSPENLVHPGAAPKLADVFEGWTASSSNTKTSSTYGSVYVQSAVAGTGNTLNRSIDSALASYYRAKGGNGAGGGGKDEDATKVLKEAKSAVSTFLNDLLTLGIESIDLSKYDKIPDDIKSGIQERINRNDSYRSFVNAYASTLEKSMSEINETYFQAWQKDLEAVGLAEEQMESLEGLSFFANGEISGSADEWVTILGDKAYIGDAVEEGVFEWNAALRQYMVKDQASLEKFMNTKIGNIWNFPDVAIDQAQSVTDEINELLTKAISGEGLSSKDKTRLEELSKKQGDTDSLKFIQASNNKFLLVTSAVSNATKSVTSTTYDALIDRIKNITSLISDAFGENKAISNVDVTTLHNQLKAAGLSDIKLTLTDKGYIASFEEVKAIYSQIVEKYPSLAAELLKNIANEELTKEQQLWKAEAFRKLSKNKDVAETYDALIERVNSVVDALSTAFGDGNHITNVQKVELDKNLAALGMDSIDLTVDSAGYIANFDTVKKGFEALVKLWPEQAANLLEKISNDELTKEQQQWKAEQLAVLSKNKLSAETLDAIRERVQNTVDIVKKAIEGTASFVDIEQLKDKLVSDKSFGVSAEEVKEKLKYITTETGNKLTKASYEWLIKVYSKEHADLVDGLIEAANEAFVQEMKNTEQQTYGVFEAIQSNFKYSPRTGLFTASLEQLKSVLNEANVGMEEFVAGLSRDIEGNYLFDALHLADFGIYFDKKYLPYLTKQGKTVTNNLTSTFADIAAEAIEKGLDNIDWNNYIGIEDFTDEDLEFAKSMAAGGSLTKFVNLYAQAAEKSIEEVNKLYFQAWEAELKTTSKDAAKGMQYYFGGGLSGSSSDWTSLLGNAVKVNDLVEAGLLSYNEKLNTYVATSLEALQNFGVDANLFDTNIIQDSIRTLFNNIIDQFGTALSEGLTNVNIDTFVENLHQQGIDLDLTFQQTLTGLKLSTESAIDLYNKLKDVDAISAQLTFKKLNENLKETNDHYRDTTRILAHIKELQDKIADASQYSDEKIKQYKEELALAKEILAVRVTSEDDSFDIANRALPGGLKNALTYANSLSDIAHEIRSAFEDADSDIIDFQMFYNMATEINNAAAALGQSIDFFGYTLDGGIDNLDDLITHAADSLGASADGGKFGVSLSKFGKDLVGGMDDFVGSTDTAMHAMAEAQIKILDGLIAMFEVIVAMEEFDKVDIDKNGLLDLDEIFNLTGLSEDAYSTAVAFNNSFTEAANILLETINSDDKWREIANSIRINGYSFVQLLEDACDGVRDIIEIPAEEYQQMISLLYEKLRNGDYDVNDIYNSLKENLMINDSNWNGTIEINDLVINVKYGVQLTKTEQGYVTPGGALYPDAKSASQGLALEAIGGTDITFDPISLTSTGTLKVGESSLEVTVSTDDSGVVTYNAPSGTYSSLDDAIEGEWHASEDGKDTQLSLEEWQITQKIKVVPVVEANLKDSDLELSQDQINAAIGKSYEEIRKEWQDAQANGTELKFEATYGVAFNETTTEEDWLKFKELAGIETKNIELNASINIIKTEGEISQLLSYGSDENSLTLKVVANTDSATSTLDQLKDKVDSTIGTAQVDANVQQAVSKLQSVVDTINKIDTSIDINVNVNQNGEIPSTSSANAKGTVSGSALAGGTRTLMGELGPELYVSNGRYHLAGQNGAEFVNLPDDAIVFNHLQTQKLLSTGSAGRGKPITNEANAVAMARGTGPAAATARETLATLKQMRAMWQSIANMSVSELAGTAKASDKENIATWIKQVEKWFTLMQKIATLEKEITQEQKIQSALQSKLIAAGDIYADSLVRNVKALSEQINLEKELADSYLQEYNKKRTEINSNSPFNRFFTFDEKGQIIYNEDHYKELVDLLNTQYEDNQLAISQPQEQVKLAKRYGLEEYMKYDSEGKKIVKEEGESASEFAVRQLDALKYSMDSMKEEIQGNYDAWFESNNTALELETERNNILKDIRDNQITLEEKVLSAIEDREQALINKLTDEREELSKASSSYIKGLQDSLSRERKLYENNQNKNELSQLQRRLDILQRSGGSQSEISSLQKELQEKMQDTYFSAQEDQIQSIQDASDLQLEKLQTQIDIMTETLEYSKEHGLLWTEVNEVLKGTSAEITAFITGNMADWQSKSTLTQEKEQEEILFIAQEFEEIRKHNEEELNDISNSLTNNLEKIREGTHIEIAQPEIIELEPESETTSRASASTSSSKKKTSNSTLAQATKQKKAEYNSQDYTEDEVNKARKAFDDYTQYIKWLNEQINICDSYLTQGIGVELYTGIKQERQTQLKEAVAKQSELRKIIGYRHGGMVTDTGLVQVHGTEARPEAFMNADEVQMWKQQILGRGSHSLLSQMLEIRALYDEISGVSSSVTHNSDSVVIEHAEVNMNVEQLANDYDARRAGANALDEMLKIARKSGTNSIRR